MRRLFEVLIAVWAIIVAGFFFATFFLVEAATYEPLARYIYMVALALGLGGVGIGAALRLVGTQPDGDKRG